MSSDGSIDISSFQREGNNKAPPPPNHTASVSPGMFFSDDSSSGEELANGQRKLTAHSKSRTLISIRPKPLKDRDKYIYYEPRDEVVRILKEWSRKGIIIYEVKLADGKTRQATFDELLSFDGGSGALQRFQKDPSPSEDDSVSAAATDMNFRQRPRKTQNQDFVDSSMLDLSDDELALQDSNSSDSLTRSRRTKRTTHWDSEESSNDFSKKRGHKRKLKSQVPVRRSGRARKPVLEDEGDESEEEESNSNYDSDDVNILQSDIRKRKRGRPLKDSERIPRTGVRQSDRATRTRNNMQEAGMDDVYRSDSEPRQEVQHKIASVREVFATLPRSNFFRARHVEGCEVCSEGPSVAPLIYCQGCSLSYHKNCIGNRNTRDHLVTKVGPDNYILQCKRCINFYRKKDSTAPDLSKCQDCYQSGDACHPFRTRKSLIQEQKDRDNNDGLDPVVNVDSRLVDNTHNVLFRCTKCSRAYHYHHLPPLSQYSMDTLRDEDETADDRFQEYSKKWLCKDCDDTQKQKVSGLIAWRPSDVTTYRPGSSCDIMSEDDKQYLIKWEGLSYFRASWHSGAWTWGVTAPVMRKAFCKREAGPKMRTEDAIPEEYLRIDIVLDIKYTSHVSIRNEEIDKARIKEVDKALIKYKGLGYEDAVWEKVPSPDEGDRWLDFVTAYNDWVAGRYLRAPKQGPLKARIDKARATDFSALEKEQQPDNLVGGELMKYQIEGLNWIYYQWYAQKNGILADEMGLGKTIQVIAYMATLVQEHNCFPFLVVVPNATCANWRREIKQWVPSLRVVTFFGSSTARDMAYKYELYPDGTKDLRAHVVVTSYEAATDDSARRVLRGVNWAGLIVDEGQRLKNDKSQLYSALNSVKAPFRLLLTGTPLQNNARELFNLLQFLDDTIDAAELEEKYSEMTSENVKELHRQIKPFILRRTKVQVLTFLPALGQVIVPLSMSTLQKSLYKSILAKNPELLKTLFTTAKSLKTQERANLSNILMQLRKCLCHPFVYSREIEERTEIADHSHRNLVEASAKLQFLELLLPKLKERGHRVLIFSQFLDMLSIIEDFMDGLQMAYQRLDGTMGSLEKQKRIDQFNAPDSSLFAFLLSTRAGGVGINLATADTVIILDPDFNPHQDIQAISRAHRIGQKKKVLCFQLMTRASAEEKIVQMGRKKMALDHVVVEQIDEDVNDEDVESILKHGAAELFKDDTNAHDIRYDDVSIDRLLDRSQIENTKTSGDASAESQFSFARVWANDEGKLADTLDSLQNDAAPDPGVWDRILKERQERAAAEALARADDLGRGKRMRTTIDYNAEGEMIIDPDDANDVPQSPLKIKKKSQKKKKRSGSESDTDFQLESGDDSPDEAANDADVDPGVDLQDHPQPSGSKGALLNPLYNQSDAGPSKYPSVIPNPTRLATRTRPAQVNLGRETVEAQSSQPASQRSISASVNPNASAVKPFKRVQLPVRSPLEPAYGLGYAMVMCPICHQQHPRGACPLKIAGVEHCGLCGLAHYGISRTCPHIRSETQVREMLRALKNSPENKNLVEAALKYLRGVKGHLVQQKKRDREKLMASAAALGAGAGSSAQSTGPTKIGSQSTVPLPASTTKHPGQSAHQGQQVGPPTSFVPHQQHGGPSHAVPGSVGSHIAQQQQPQPPPPPPQQQQQQQHPMDIDDSVVEGALRGFLGR
ncbi:PHD/FYVE-zinc-finger like domain-containing protein [Dendryphion nanum]|uniref:PHD/FYVE-zinc-finger like domain-containing protein n=1 Tax=Dendryphion nanum TaxID=256645 RepID=A0A9P9IU08_9PLEO|nr:PHD/FYVE-zinc-finger like domain-containing protein [Dendryphion nanum]